MAAKKPNRKPKVLTLGDVGAPQVTYHQPGEIPLAHASDRFAFLDWEKIHTAIVDGQVAAFTCEPGEKNAAMRCLYQFVHDQDECCCPAMESRYNSNTGRLFVYSLVQKAG